CGVMSMSGCTNPLAVNYNPAATEDDGSCLYPAPNDECADAIALTVNENQDCTSVTSGTLGATESAGGDDCSGNANDDVWFSFTATSGTHYVDILNVSPYADMYHAVYSGSCGALVNMVCSDGNS